MDYFFELRKLSKLRETKNSPESAQNRCEESFMLKLSVMNSMPHSMVGLSEPLVRNTTLHLIRLFLDGHPIDTVDD